MSSVVVSVGQCGNQIGNELMSLLDRSSDVHPFSHRDGNLRYVCVDSESKVVSRIYQEDKKFSGLYRGGNMIAGQRGRGNNWALGYYGLAGETEETSLLQRTMDILRKEIERCDNYSGAIVVHSLAGGTGSGLGSHLLEKIRDTYPLTYVLSVAIGPHRTGDSPLQHYNSLLSLASLQCHADAVLLYNNDDVLHHVASYSGFTSRKTLSKAISLEDMNCYIAASLAGVLQPLGKKPQRILKKHKEKCTRSDKLYKEGKNKLPGFISGPDATISKRLSFSSIDGSCYKPCSSQMWSSVGDTSGASVMLEDCQENIPFSGGGFESLDKMSKQPRNSSSALLRYKDIISHTDVKKHRASNPNNCQSSKLAVSVTTGDEPWEMLRSVCAEPSAKFASVHHIAKPKVSWESLTQSLLHSIRRYDKSGRQFSTVGSLLVVRGDEEGSFAEVSTKVEDRLRTSLKFVDWNPFPVDFWISQYNTLGPRGSQSLTLCLNSTSIVQTLENVMSKARTMYDAGAYLHWFWKYGCSQSDFEDAFHILDSVVAEYKNASI